MDQTTPELGVKGGELHGGGGWLGGVLPVSPGPGPSLGQVFPWR